MFTFVIVLCDVLCKSYIVALFTVVHISTFVAQNVSNKAFSNSNSCPGPRWVAQTAPQTPSSRAAAGVAKCNAFGVTMVTWGF